MTDQDKHLDVIICEKLYQYPEELTLYYQWLLLEGKSYKTAKVYINCIVSFFDYKFKSILPKGFYKQVTADDITEYLEISLSDNEKSISNFTKATRWTALNSFFAFIVPKFMIENPMDTVNRPTVENMPMYKKLSDAAKQIVFNASIDELCLSRLTHVRLKKANITTIGDLCDMTAAGLSIEAQMTSKQIDEIKNSLSMIGCSLRKKTHTNASEKEQHPQIARKNSWKRKPRPDIYSLFDLQLPLTTEQYEVLKRGNVPHNMDQWFFYYERGKLHFYRWTGMCYFSVTLNEISGFHHVKTYIYDPDGVAKWKNEAPKMIQAILERYSEV